MSNQPNEAAQRYSPCREKSETLVGGVVTTMRPNDQGNWVRYSLLRKAEAEIASLRSALAAAEKRADEWREWANSAFIERDDARARLAEAERDCAGYKERIHELSDELGACEKERDEAWAKLAEAEEARDEALAERDEMAGRYNMEMEIHAETRGEAIKAIRDWTAALTERSALAAQLAEARGLLGDLLAWLTSPKMQTWQYHENGFFAEDAQKFVNRLSLAPPPDRGAEGRS